LFPGLFNIVVLSHRKKQKAKAKIMKKSELFFSSKITLVRSRDEKKMNNELIVNISTANQDNDQRL
jgi:hypothetical protein